MRTAFKNSAHEYLTYADLEAKSFDFASYLVSEYPLETQVVLIGHKSPAMLVGMLGAMQAHCPYVPLDSSFPFERMDRIVSQLDAPLIVWAGASFELPEAWQKYPTFDLEAFCQTGAGVSPTLSAEEISRELRARDEVSTPADALYILFTSGSTGVPKGVIQTRQTLDATCEYFEKFIPSASAESSRASSNPLVFFNRTHFSFDVSVFDIAMALGCGHTLFALAEADETSLKSTFGALQENEIDVWISTPSFLNMCLCDPSFTSELLPHLKCIIVCGEVLLQSTAQRTLERFRDAALYNTYGPTETQAITDVCVTPEMAGSDRAIPIGTVSPHNRIEIQDVDTHEPCAPGESGEIVIFGDTIAQGYYHQPEKTAAAFGEIQTECGHERFYRTGDEGFIDETGMLHYLGRFDLQVKINGYRVELQEIETALEQLPEIAQACVVPVVRSEISAALFAYVIPQDTMLLSCDTKQMRAHTKAVKDQIKMVLPAYMLPRTYTWVDAFPSNVNGKIDRKALAAQAAGGRNA